MTAPAEFNTDTAVDFLWQLVPDGVPEGERLVLFAKGASGNRTIVLESPDDLHRHAGELAECDVWYSLATRHDHLPPGSRGGAADCRHSIAFGIDLDVLEGSAPGAHKGDSDKVYRTWADARADAAAIGRTLTPTWTIHTGNGLQLLYALDEPVPAADWQPWLDRIKRLAHDMTDGRADPAVFDVPRIMRLPGTVNCKGGERRPVVIEHHDPNAEGWSLYELDTKLPPTPVPERASTPAVVNRAGALARPGDDYSAEQIAVAGSPNIDPALGVDPSQPGDAHLISLLERAGWRLWRRHGRPPEVRRHPDDGRFVFDWVRPGKNPDDGPSATLNWVAPGILHVFSSADPVLPAGTYDPFGILARTVYGGDFTAAAEALAAKGYGTAVEPLGHLPELTDRGVETDFTEATNGDLIYASGIGWLEWDGRRYAHDEEGHALARRLNSYTDALYAEALARLAAVPANDDDARKTAERVVGAAKVYVTASRRRVLAESLKAVLSVPADALDSGRDLNDEPADLLNCRNGVIDLRTGELLPHAKGYGFTRVASVDYDPNATSADWTRALEALPTDMRTYLRDVVGMAAIGRPQADQFFIAVGSGGNGKTTILRAVRYALGDYGVDVPAGLLMGGKDRRPQELMGLRGARFALAEESGEDRFLDMERIKHLTGGSSLTDRHLFARSEVTWLPSHTLFLATNHQPRVRQTDEGTWRRLRLLPFDVSYRGAPDRGLKDRLVDMEHNRRAVLAWIVAGAVRWHQRAAAMVDPTPDEPADVVNVTTAWRDGEDPIVNFLDAAGYVITGHHDDMLPSGATYDRYRQVTLDAGGSPLGGARFVAELTAHAKRHGHRVFVHRMNNGRQLRGIRAATGAELTADNAATADDPW